MIDARLTLTAPGGSTRDVLLSTYLEPAAEEDAHAAEYAWIKDLRNLIVDGARFRDRFMVRGDSLWWFSELYLHKQRVVFDIHRVIAALTAVIDAEQPRGIAVRHGDLAVRHLVSEMSRRGGLPGSPTVSGWAWRRRLLQLDIRARRLTLSALAAPERYRRGSVSGRRSRIAAFVHRAFWKDAGADGGAEAYIGPVLRDLEGRLGREAIAYVGVGPATNFRTRRRWAVRAHEGSAIVPVERFAPLPALHTSRQVWRERYVNSRILSSSRALREAARIRGIDCWPILREELAGIAWLQWPWSVRAMDEAGAALDRLSPDAVLTYAEAGGWGRALVLEARRRGIPSAGLQHGFIYRTWLNYRHEPDEMSADEREGFPRPTRTLLFDAYAASHLESAGRFPRESLQVTGSPRLDLLARSLTQVTAETIGRIRRDAALAPDDLVVLVATKEREARRVLPQVIDAGASVPRLVLVIKPHPAETADAYAWAVRGRRPVRVLAPDTPLAPLLAMARAVLTVNSTVALDAGVLGVPAVVVGLPNNLSPFVAGGALAGATTPDELRMVLERILYDEKFRQQLADGRRVMFGRAAMAADGGAAARMAAAVDALLGTRTDERDQRTV